MARDSDSDGLVARILSDLVEALAMEGQVRVRLHTGPLPQIPLHPGYKSGSWHTGTETEGCVRCGNMTLNRCQDCGNPLCNSCTGYPHTETPFREPPETAPPGLP